MRMVTHISGTVPTNDPRAAIAECLTVHAEAIERFGTDHPELHPTVPVELRDKVQRQRVKVSVTLEGVDPISHAAHVAALTKGLRLVIRKLAPCS
jgi:hypothetical protein